MTKADTDGGLGLLGVLLLHTGQALVGVLQQLLDVTGVLLLKLELLLLKVGHGVVQLETVTKVLP